MAFGIGMSIRIKRVYDPPEPGDGRRILIDRLWPRGLTKDAAALDEWLRELAPSTELRRWFGHEPARWEEFQRRYRAELDERPEFAVLRERAAREDLTLLYGARDPAHNNAVALRDYLDGR